MRVQFDPDINFSLSLVFYFDPIILQSKYMTKEWDVKHENLMVGALRKLAEFEANHSTSSDMDLVCMHGHL